MGHVPPSTVCGNQEDSRAPPSGARTSFCMDAPQNGFLLKSIDLKIGTDGAEDFSSVDAERLN